MKEKRGISGSTVKIIAIISMLIDHIGAGILGRYLAQAGIMEVTMESSTQWLAENGKLYLAYWVMRMIGRLGFPIFCFLLVEGFQHTHDVKKYAARLFAFCIISEVPFDLLLAGKPFDLGYQNVFFTLLIGLLTMCVFRYIEKQDWKKGVRIISYIAALAVGMVVAEFLNTDYGAIGVLSIMILYMFRESRPRQIVAGCITFLWEITAPLAFVPIGFYNGKRGLKMKYFFYIFYPAHLLIIYLVAVALGMNGYSAV